jgi:hypothetical protein
MKAIIKYPFTLLAIFISLFLIFVMAIFHPTFVKKGILFLTKKWDKMLKPTKKRK